MRALFLVLLCNVCQYLARRVQSDVRRFPQSLGNMKTRALASVLAVGRPAAAFSPYRPVKDCFLRLYRTDYARSRPRRAVSANMQSDTEIVPVVNTIDEVASEAVKSIRDSLFRGVRAMRVDIKTGALQPGKATFDEYVLARVCLTLAESLKILEGQVLLLFPDLLTLEATTWEMQCDYEAGENLDNKDRVRVSTLGFEGPPPAVKSDSDDDTPLAGVILVLPGPTADDRNCRAWMKFAGAQCPVVCLNQAYDASSIPDEISGYDTAYSYATFSAPAKKIYAILRRASPDPWQLLSRNPARKYELVAEWDEEPDQVKMFKTLMRAGKPEKDREPRVLWKTVKDGYEIRYEVIEAPDDDDD